MEYIDDDFGDLYADVEVQASSAIGVSSKLTRLHLDIGVERNGDASMKTNSHKVLLYDSDKVDTFRDFVDAPSGGASVLRENVEEENGASSDNESDSEDDLNIVLNDDERRYLSGPVGKGDREKEEVFNAFVEGNQNDGLEMVPEKSKGAKGSYISHLPHYKAASVHAKAIPATYQSRYGFSLPWYRTILDVNIEMFEQKPWRLQGADLTDFFNYGLNEQSWKSYCKSVACQAGFERDKLDCQACEEASQGGQGGKDTELGVREVRQPKGRAIHVEDNVCERQPSIDVRRPRPRDPDVVIEIDVQRDSLGNPSDSDHKEPGNADSTVQGASENGELSTESLGGSGARLEGRNLRRCLQPENFSKLSPGGSVYGDGHQKKGDACFSEGNHEVVEMQNNSDEGTSRKTCSTDSYSMEVESSLYDWVLHSPSSPCSETHSEASEDEEYIVPEKLLESTSSDSMLVLKESNTSDYYCSKDFKINDVEVNRYIVKDHKRGLIQDKEASCSRGPQRVAESSVKCDYDCSASPMIDVEISHDKDNLLIGHDEWKDRSRLFGLHDRKDVPYYKVRETLSDYCGQRFSGDHNQVAYPKNYCSKNYHIYKARIDPGRRERWGEKGCYLKGRCPRVDDDLLHRDWHYQNRQLTIDNLDHIVYGNSPRLVATSYPHPNEVRSRRRGWKGDKDYFRNGDTNNDPLYECSFVDDIMQEKCRSRFTNREKNLLDKRHVNYARYSPREVDKFGRWDIYVDHPLSCINDSSSTRFEDNCRRAVNCEFSSSYSYKKSPILDKRRWHDTMSLREDADGLRPNGRFDRRSVKPVCGGYTMDWDGQDNDHSTLGGINYSDDQVHFQRRHGRGSKVFCSSERVFSMHQDHLLYEENASLLHERVPKNTNAEVKNDSGHDRMPFKQHMRWQKCKMIREGNNGFVSEKYNVFHRYKDGQAVMKCGDSVDLVGKRKSYGIEDEDINCTDMHGTSGSKMKDSAKFKDANGPHREKDENPDAQKKHSNQNDKWLDKFPVTGHDEDVEEGPIVTDEPDRSGMEKKKFIGLTSNRILETLAKMERRRERFKEPLSLKKEPDKNSMPRVDAVVETSETKQTRPIRKRRWGVR